MMVSFITRVVKVVKIFLKENLTFSMYCAIFDYMVNVLYTSSMKSLTIKQIPDEALAGFKAYCALKGIRMTDALIAFMREKAAQVQLQGEQGKK